MSIAVWKKKDKKNKLSPSTFEALLQKKYGNLFLDFLKDSKVVMNPLKIRYLLLYFHILYIFIMKYQSQRFSIKFLNVKKNTKVVILQNPFWKIWKSEDVGNFHLYFFHT